MTEKIYRLITIFLTLLYFLIDIIPHPPYTTKVLLSGSGLVFPGTDEKSIKWNDTNDHYSIIGGDLKVSGDKLYMAGTKILDNDDGGEKTINHDIRI